MRTDSVVEGLQIGKHIVLSRCSRRVLLDMDQLAFETAEEIFGHGVVVGVTPAGHALADAVRLQPFPVGPGGILHALVAVEDKVFGPGLRRRYAISRAATVSRVSMRSEKAYPTIFLVHRSFTIARYSHLLPVGM